MEIMFGDKNKFVFENKIANIHFHDAKRRFSVKDNIPVKIGNVGIISFMFQ